MAHIHWYPGHIAKAEKKLKELINLVDVVIEVLDARIPESSVYPDIKKILGEKPRLIVLNKADLSDEKELKEWIKYYQEKTGFPVIASCASKNNDISIIVSRRRCGSSGRKIRHQTSDGRRHVRSLRQAGRERHAGPAAR